MTISSGTPEIMPSKKLFRYIVVAQLFLLAAGLATVLHFEPIINQAKLIAGVGIPSPAAGMMAVFGLIGLIVSATGILTFRNWARHAYSASVAVLLASEFFDTRLLVTTHVGDGIESITILLQGITLALVYFSPLKSLFSRRLAD